MASLITSCMGLFSWFLLFAAVHSDDPTATNTTINEQPPPTTQPPPVCPDGTHEERVSYGQSYFSVVMANRDGDIERSLQGGVEGARGGMDKVEYTGPIIIRSPLPDRNFTLKTLTLRIKAARYVEVTLNLVHPIVTGDGNVTSTVLQHDSVTLDRFDARPHMGEDGQNHWGDININPLENRYSSSFDATRVTAVTIRVTPERRRRRQGKTPMIRELSMEACV